MSAANHARKNIAKFMFALGLGLLSLSFFTSPGTSSFLLLIAAILLVIAVIMFASVSLIDSGAWFIQRFFRRTPPKWHAEIMYTDGGEYAIRYDFDADRTPRFLAEDIYAAIGVDAKDQSTIRRSRGSLVTAGEYTYFTAETVQSFLSLIAPQSHAAKRLLVIIRSGVLRMVAKQEENTT